MNRIARIQVIRLIFLNCPQITFRTTYEIIPSMIPSEMLYARGIMIMQMYAGILSEKSVKSTSRIDVIIMQPTRIRAGAVAAEGIAVNSGAKNNAIAKQIATVNDVRPVRPPSATPDALST